MKCVFIRDTSPHNEAVDLDEDSEDSYILQTKDGMIEFLFPSDEEGEKFCVAYNQLKREIKEGIKEKEERDKKSVSLSEVPPVSRKRRAEDMEEQEQTQSSDSNKAEVEPVVRPLVVMGLAPEDRDNPVRLKKRLHGWFAHCANTKKTSLGKILLFPKTAADAKKIKETKIEGLTVREAYEKREEPKIFVLINRIHPSTTEAEITEETGRLCKRILAANRGGAPTWKVKIECLSTADQSVLLRDGIKIGLENFRVSEYISRKKPIICYRCQKPGHTARGCKGEERCRKCAGNHDGRVCKSRVEKCANCEGEHSSTSYQCPVLLKAKESISQTEVSPMERPPEASDTANANELQAIKNIIVIAKVVGILETKRKESATSEVNTIHEIIEVYRAIHHIEISEETLKLRLEQVSELIREELNSNPAI